MTERPNHDDHSEQSQEGLNWPATEDADASINQDGSESGTAPGARRRRHLADGAAEDSQADGTAPDQRTPQDIERDRDRAPRH